MGHNENWIAAPLLPRGWFDVRYGLLLCCSKWRWRRWGCPCVYNILWECYRLGRLALQLGASVLGAEGDRLHLRLWVWRTRGPGVGIGYHLQPAHPSRRLWFVVIAPSWASASRSLAFKRRSGVSSIQVAVVGSVLLASWCEGIY